MNTKININQVAELLEVNLITLRRWDRDGIFQAHRDTPTSHRYYFENDLADFLSNNFKYLFKLAAKWAFSQEPIDIPSRFYCADAFVFKARLSSLAVLLQKMADVNNLFSLVVSVVGEIGENSFDHNIGNWPNIPGIFFGYSLNEKKVILADRGQGVLTTLKRVKPELKNHKEALEVAFTEIISGRRPENRGNGLKYVRKIVAKNKMSLKFHSGDGVILIDDNINNLTIIDADKFMKGCFVTLKY